MRVRVRERERERERGDRWRVLVHESSLLPTAVVPLILIESCSYIYILYVSLFNDDWVQRVQAVIKKTTLDTSKNDRTRQEKSQ